MGAKLYAGVRYFAQGNFFATERLDLETAGVGENGMGPVHKGVNTTKFFDVFGSGAKKEVIVVGQNYLGS